MDATLQKLTNEGVFEHWFYTDLPMYQVINMNLLTNSDLRIVSSFKESFNDFYNIFRPEFNFLKEYYFGGEDIETILLRDGSILLKNSLEFSPLDKNKTYLVHESNLGFNTDGVEIEFYRLNSTLSSKRSKLILEFNYLHFEWTEVSLEKRLNELGQLVEKRKIDEIFIVFNAPLRFLDDKPMYFDTFELIERINKKFPVKVKSLKMNNNLSIHHLKSFYYSTLSRSAIAYSYFEEIALSNGAAPLELSKNKIVEQVLLTPYHCIEILKPVRKIRDICFDKINRDLIKVQPVVKDKQVGDRKIKKKLVISEFLQLILLDREVDSDNLSFFIKRNLKQFKKIYPWAEKKGDHFSSESYINWRLTEYLERKSLMLGVFFKNRLVGLAGFNSINENKSEANFSIMLGKEVQKTAVSKEIYNFLSGYIANNFNVQTITAAVNSENIPAQKYFLNLGFEKYKVIKNGCVFIARKIDFYIYKKDVMELVINYHKINYGDFLNLKSLLEIKGVLDVKVATSSMEPFIKKGSHVLVRSIDLNLISVKDILIYYINGILRCHYVYEISYHERDNQPIFHLKGIANLWNDRPIDEGAILGVVVSHKLPPDVL